MGVTRKLILALSCLVICLAFVPAAGADTTITGGQCASLTGHVVQAGTPNLTLDCAISATDLIFTTPAGGSITVTSNGSITTTGIAGMRLFAGLNGSGTACANPSQASLSTIDIQGAPLTDMNSNGGIQLRSCWDITFEQGTSVISASLSGGTDNIKAQCFEPSVTPPAASPWGCQIKVDHSAFFGNRIFMSSQGDMTLICSTFGTASPLDKQTYQSIWGNLFAGEVCAGGTLLTCADAKAFVDAHCVDGFINCPLDLPCPDTCCHNEFSGGVESNIFFYAEQEVDLSAACVNIAENITITAIGRFPTSPYNPTGGGVGPGGAYYMTLERAEIRDDFGKTGHINITALPPLKSGQPYKPDDVPFLPPNAGYACSASWFGIGDIYYQDSILVDDGANGGGVDPKAVSFMNGCRATQPGNCGAVVPTCTNRAIPNRGWVANPTNRQLHHVVGTAKCDS